MEKHRIEEILTAFFKQPELINSKSFLQKKAPEQITS